MSAQVIFLNPPYCPDAEEWQRLDAIQEFLHFANIQFLYESRGLPLYEVSKRKDAVHERARERIHIVEARLNG